MRFLAALTAATAIFAGSALAGPVPNTDVGGRLEERAPFVTCSPTLEGSGASSSKGKGKGKASKPTVKTFKVDLAAAEASVRAAGITTGTSGDPHRYHNGDGIVFNKNNCDKKDSILWEFPVYWVGFKKEGVKQKDIDKGWLKDGKSGQQPLGSTPLRGVYANVNGGIYFCGVMTHSTVTANNQGKGFFQLCT